MTPSLLKAIESFTDPELELDQLDEALRTVHPDNIGSSEIQALFGIFERFPDHDGFGVFWSIVHLLEASKDHELDLIASVKRKPVHFNLLMVNRLLNAEILEINGESLLALLTSVSSHPAASDTAKTDARGFLEYQMQQGRTKV
jgi:hypothetical protein